MRLCFAVLLLAPLAFGQHAAPKNLKILPAENLIPTMRTYTVALGVKCDFCHVQGDFASDAKEEKGTARHMIKMVHDINANFRGDKQRVTCYTCHRGAKEPATAPPAAEKSGD